MKNWKSFTTWLIFAIAFNYSVYSKAHPEVVWYTGLFTLVMGIVFVFRNEMTTELIGKLIDKIGIKKGSE